MLSSRRHVCVCCEAANGEHVWYFRWASLHYRQCAQILAHTRIHSRSPTDRKRREFVGWVNNTHWQTCSKWFAPLPLWQSHELSRYYFCWSAMRPVMHMCAWLYRAILPLYELYLLHDWIQRNALTLPSISVFAIASDPNTHKAKHTALSRVNTWW